MPLAHIKTGKTWTVMTGGKPYQFDKAHPNYDELVKCIARDDSAKFVELTQVGESVQTWSEGNFRFANGVLFYKNEQVVDVIAAKIVEHMSEKFPFAYMLRFVERLYSNPSRRAISEIYNFIVHKQLPITTDGYIIMYKAVRPNFHDKWTGTIDNSPGQHPSMPRHQVCDDPRNGCAPGLHAGSIEFVKGYGSSGDHVMILKVDPADVVCVPFDCSCQKVRTCGYEVLSEWETDLLSPVYGEDVRVLDEDDDYDYDDDDDDEDDDEDY